MNRSKVNIFIIIFFMISAFIIVFNTNKYIVKYNECTNKVISSVVANVNMHYPEVSEREIIDILNNENLDDTFFKDYGVDLIDEASIEAKLIVHQLYFTDIALTTLLFLVILVIINVFINKNNRDIKKLIYYVEEINKKNYKLDMISNSEGIVSILQNEIYKTMVMLKESADNSFSDKVSIKNSLSDISHQLKTPLTSISIALDNIIDDPDMDSELRNDFIMDIKRDIININFLVYNILRLSQFDTNTVKMKREVISVNDVLRESIKNVSMLADLKNVTIEFNELNNAKIKGDFKWEIEAISNILKNSIEYSNEGKNVLVNVNETNLFTEISIRDFGKGIEKKNTKKIFERFYKLNDSDNGFGIGLSLAKEIIEADNGRIKVKSEVDVGTEFIIRYIK